MKIRNHHLNRPTVLPQHTAGCVYYLAMRNNSAPKCVLTENDGAKCNHRGTTSGRGQGGGGRGTTKTVLIEASTRRIHGDQCV